MGIKEELSDEQLKNAIAFLANEHSALQTGRSGTIFEANGRTTVYLSSVSSALVALAFIGQVSNMGQAFYIFSLVLFPCLFFIGLVTFHRALQATAEDMVYTMGLSRIRHFYIEVVPELKDYIILTKSDNLQSAGKDDGVKDFWWQMFVTTAGMVAIINSVLAGVFAGMVSGALSGPLWLCLVCGIFVALISIVLHMRYQLIVWKRVDDIHKPIFPDEP